MSGLGMIEFSNFGEPDLGLIEFLNFGGLDLDVIKFSNFGGSDLDVIEFSNFGGPDLDVIEFSNFGFRMCLNFRISVFVIGCDWCFEFRCSYSGMIEFCSIPFEIVGFWGVFE